MVMQKAPSVQKRTVFHLTTRSDKYLKRTAVLLATYAPFKNFIGSSGAAPLRTWKWSWGVLTLPV
jgi:hypothetical protein